MDVRLSYHKTSDSLSHFCVKTGLKQRGQLFKKIQRCIEINSLILISIRHGIVTSQ